MGNNEITRTKHMNYLGTLHNDYFSFDLLIQRKIARQMHVITRFRNYWWTSDQWIHWKTEFIQKKIHCVRFSKTETFTQMDFLSRAEQHSCFSSAHFSKKRARLIQWQDFENNFCLVIRSYRTTSLLNWQAETHLRQCKKFPSYLFNLQRRQFQHVFRNSNPESKHEGKRKYSLLVLRSARKSRQT